MKPTTGRIGRGPDGIVALLCAHALTWALVPIGAAAQELVVVLSSAQDAASADKLAELIREPFERVDAASLGALQPTAAGGCRTRARLELSLDSVGQAVRLVRCRDATVFARGVDPGAASHTPYLSAFVAAELLTINRELEAVDARTISGERQSPVPAAAPSGSQSPPVAPAAQAPAAQAPASALELHFRAGAELTLWGAPFDHAVRPNLGLGAILAPDSPDFAWLAELSFGLFALAEEQRATETLALQRHDAQLHAGVRFGIGPLYLAGFALLRASLTRARYSADLTTESSQLRLGVGAGLEADMPLSRVFSVYLQAKLDLATSRSEYRVAGFPWVSDPASLLWVGMGFLVRLRP